MNFDEWYRQSPTRLTGPTAEDIERGRRFHEEYDRKRAAVLEKRCTCGSGLADGLCANCWPQ